MLADIQLVNTDQIPAKAPTLLLSVSITVWTLLIHFLPETEDKVLRDCYTTGTDHLGMNGGIDKRKGSSHGVFAYEKERR